MIRLHNNTIALQRCQGQLMNATMSKLRRFAFLHHSAIASNIHIPTVQKQHLTSKCTMHLSSSSSLPLSPSLNFVSFSTSSKGSINKSSEEKAAHERWLKSQERARTLAGQSQQQSSSSSSSSESPPTTPLTSQLRHESAASFTETDSSSSGGFTGGKRTWTDLVLVSVVFANVWIYVLSGLATAEEEKLRASKVANADSSSASTEPSSSHVSAHPLRTMLEKHFVASERNIAEGRYYVLLTYAFAHTDATHLLENLVPFLLVGRGVVQAIGLRHFTPLYFASALAGSLAFFGWNRICDRAPLSASEQAKQQQRIQDILAANPSIQQNMTPQEIEKEVALGGYSDGLRGASSAVFAFLAMWSFIYRNKRVALGSTIRLPLGPMVGLATVGLTMLNVAGAAQQKMEGGIQQGHPGYVAHVAGALVGVAYFFSRFRSPAARQQVVSMGSGKPFVMPQPSGTTAPAAAAAAAAPVVRNIKTTTLTPIRPSTTIVRNKDRGQSKRSFTSGSFPSTIQRRW